jgi:hypothetical protein
LLGGGARAAENGPRKYLRKSPVELPSIDPLGNKANDIGAAAWLVTAEAVRMSGFEPVQDTGSVQKMMHEGIDGDQRHADFKPPGARLPASIRMPGNAMASNLVRNAVDIAQWLNQGVGSLIFIMASLLAPRHWSTAHIHDLWLPALVIIGAFAARAAVLFGLIAVLSDLQLSRPMSMPPTSWRSLVRSKIVALCARRGSRRD